MEPKILIVDDHEVLREGLKALLTKSRPNWQICGEATNGVQAVQFAQDLNPDLIIMDISMPGASGLEASARIRKLGLTLPILIFTTHESERLSTEVRQCGAQGLVLKTQAARDLVLAIDTILRGGTFFGGPSKPDPEGQDKSRPGIISGFLFRLVLSPGA